MERSGKSVYADDSPEFFRIYFANTCSQQLRIPPGFVVKFHGSVPQIFMLEGPKGKSWQIVVKKEEDQSLFLGEGWPNFVQDNSLEDGDFLTFCYDGGSNFYVKIFGKHACRKNVAITGKSKDNAGKFNNNTGIIRRRLRPRDDRGRVISTTLSPANETCNLSIVPFTGRTSPRKDDADESSNTRLMIQKPQRLRDAAGKFISTRLIRRN